MKKKMILLCCLIMLLSSITVFADGEYKTGMYKVGMDMPAGEYILFASGGKGYFCVSSDSNAKDILFNDNFEYNSIITVLEGEYLDLSRCYAVPISENPDVDTTGTGMFKVGLHIPAGEYKLNSGNQKGYYCIYSDSRQDDIIANDNFEGQSYVTVNNGQYLELARCYFVDLPQQNLDTVTISDNEISLQNNNEIFGEENSEATDYDELIQKTQSNLKPYIAQLGMETYGKSINVTQVFLDGLSHTEIMGIDGNLELGFTKESATVIALMEWVSNDSFTQKEYYAFLPKIDALIDAEPTIASYDNISDVTHVWIDYENMCVVLGWYENNHIHIRYDYDPEYVNSISK